MAPWGLQQYLGEEGLDQAAQLLCIPCWGEDFCRTCGPDPSFGKPKKG